MIDDKDDQDDIGVQAGLHSMLKSLLQGSCKTGDQHHHHHHHWAQVLVDRQEGTVLMGELVTPCFAPEALSSVGRQRLL